MRTEQCLDPSGLGGQPRDFPQPSPPWSPGLSTVEMVPTQAGMQHPLQTLNIPSPHNWLHTLGYN